MKIDNYYKFVASTFGFSYFVGIVIGFIYSLLGYVVADNIDYTTLFFLSSTIQFKETFVTFFYQGIHQMFTPFLYLIESVKYGFMHVSMLTSAFLGQIKLLVQLFPQLFYFVCFIIFSTIGLKIIIFIIKSLVNYIYNQKKEKLVINLKIFNTDDALLFYIGLGCLSVGVFIQLFLSKIFFIFLINFQLVTYIFIILVYLVLIIVCLLLTYKTIFSLLKSFEKFLKKM